MKQVLTVACKIEVTPEQLAKVQETFRVFANACDYVNWHGDADLNGAKNIETMGRSINTPGGSGLVCSLSEHVLGLLKTPRSA